MLPLSSISALRLSVMLVLCLCLFAGCRTNFNSASKDTVTAPAGLPPEFRVSPEDADAAEPAIAVDPEGRSYVLYVEHYADKTADIFLKKFDAAGRPDAEGVRVNSVPRSAKAWRGDPPTISVGKDGAVHVVWTRRFPDGQLAGNDLVISVSRDAGRTFAEPVKVNDDAMPASHGMHSLAVDRTGRIYIAWLDERNVAAAAKHVPARTAAGKMAAMQHEAAEPNSELFYAVSTDGGSTFSANKKIAADVCPCCKTSLLAGVDGTIYVAWRQVLEGERRHVAVAHSNDSGETFSAGVIASDDNWQINACPVSGASMLSAENGLLDVLWYTAGAAGQPGMYFARSGDGGKSFGPRVLVSSESTSGTPVLLGAASGRSLAVFQAADEKVVSVDWQDRPVDGLTRSSVAKASLPAAVAVNGTLITAFVRSGPDKKSVWVARMPLR